MRSEKEMMELIINTAKADDRIRAVIMGGSRANTSIQKDCYQDFDIVYFVDDFDFFINNQSWINIFGERVILEMPAYKDFTPDEYNGEFNYQMLFKDGNRIDLTFAKKELALSVVERDPVAIVLLDKDGILENAKFSGPEVYIIKAPSKKDFENSCNSFWWILQNVAKGLNRRELPYAIEMLQIAQVDLKKMVCWYIGMENSYSVSPGKMGKYFENYLTKDEWELYTSIYPSGNYESVWNSLFNTCNLFRQFATKLAVHFTYQYPYEDDQAMTHYLRKLQGKF